MAVKLGRKFFELVLTDVLRHKLDATPGNLQQGNFPHLLRPQFDRYGALSDLYHRSLFVSAVGMGPHSTRQGSIEILGGQGHVPGIPDFVDVLGHGGRFR